MEQVVPEQLEQVSVAGLRPLLVPCKPGGKKNVLNFIERRYLDGLHSKSEH